MIKRSTLKHTALGHWMDPHTRRAEHCDRVIGARSTNVRFVVQPPIYCIYSLVVSSSSGLRGHSTRINQAMLPISHSALTLRLKWLKFGLDSDSSRFIAECTPQGLLKPLRPRHVAYCRRLGELMGIERDVTRSH